MGRTDIRGVLSFSCSYWNFQQAMEPPVYPFCEEEVDRIAPYRMAYSRSPFLLFSILQAGRIRYTVDEGSFYLNAGEALVIPLDAGYRFESFSTGAKYRKSVLEIRGLLLKAFAQSLSLDRVFKFRPDDPEDLLRHFHRIGLLLRENRQAHVPELMGRTHFLLNLFSAAAKPAQTPPERLQKAQTLIEDSLQLPVSVARLEEELGVSHSTLDRLFRNYLGLSAGEYWVRRKILAAEYLLKNTDLSIKELSFRLGYSSQFHFSNMFKKRRGVSPRDFRKKLLGNQTINIGPNQNHIGF